MPPAQNSLTDQLTAFPLSFGQQRLWFLEQLEPNSSLYNMPIVVRMTGRLDFGALEQSLQALAARHEALRTRFVCLEENPMQIVDAEPTIKLRLVDLSGGGRGAGGTEVWDADGTTRDTDRSVESVPTREGEAGREAEAKRLIQAEVNRPFDLGTEQLVRAMLLRLGSEEHLFVVVMHHIISDEWSLKIFFRELADFYDGFVRGRPAALAELPIQYADYAVWQREWLEGEIFEKQLGFWRDQLAGNPPVTELPASRERRSRPAFRGSSQTRALGGDLRDALKKLAQGEEATLFMVLLAGFDALLYRYTQEEDIIVGSPISGRHRLETEDLIGFFVNTLPLRTNLAGNPTFQELLGRVRETTLGAFAHQDLPFDKLVAELQPERSLNHMPFTKVMFVVQQAPLEEAQMAGLKVEFLDLESCTAKFDITVYVQESSHGMEARIEYNRDLFDSAGISRLLEHFETLLQGIAANPKQRLSELPLLGAEEQRQLLGEWNNTAADYPRGKSIAELFEAQAEKAPEAIAVVFGEQALTYRELNVRANQLANYLKHFKIGLETPVGICVERSVEMVVGLLAILKAGGAYVPLDKNYPKDRLAFMMEDTQTPVLLTQQHLLSQLPRHSAKVICLDADWELIARESRENPGPTATSESLAYVMYTSGSTGKPKGVAVPHRAVNRLVFNSNFIRLDAGDRIAQVSNISFDAATFEIWGALLNGAKLIGITRDVALSSRDFARELREQGISAIFLTAAVFNQVASEVPGAFETVGTVIAGGEALDPKWVRAVLKQRPPQRLVNGYGPSENTTFTCCYHAREVPKDATNVPIGRPISNTQVYILDRHLNLVPIGAPGELHAGGDGLARGYWNRPQMTAEKFILNPFEKGSSPQYLYKTGDLARYLADGNIEFLGRLDQQVKIRGFRIELGEIETILGEHSGVRECVVTVCGKATAEKRLVAYFVPSGKPAPNASELRNFLTLKLPDYMVPSAFVELELLPLTPNGKVDRSALPAPDQGRPELEKRYAAPRDEVELRLTKIWEEVLGVRPIGIEDKFFDLGGHSLLAVRVIGQMEKAFGRKLRLATIFQAPTIQQLAAIIREEIAESSVTTGTSLVEIQASGSRPPLFLVHGAGGGMFWGYVNLSRHLGHDQPVYGFKSRGLDGQEELGRIEEMAAQYIGDLRSMQPRGPYYLGGYCFGGNIAFEMARQLTAQGEEVALLALLNCAPPNSEYCRMRWTPIWWLRFSRNLLYWANYFTSLSSAQRREFFRWKWEGLKKRLAGFRGAAQAEASKVDAGSLVDLSSFPPEQRRVWEAHIRALLDYHPEAYAGRVHLFRSPGHPLWCSFDPHYGWDEVAKGGVTMAVVPGAHERILEEPCVKVVAAELEKVLRGNQGPMAEARMQADQRPPLTKSIQPRKRAETAPLSLGQQRVWVLEQLEPGQPAHCQFAVLRIKGDLNAEVLEESLSEIIRRHEVLRTVFPSENGNPVQRIRPAAQLRLDRLEGRTFSEAELFRIVEEASRRPFDLTCETPIRPTLVKWEEKDHSLLLFMHELAADAETLTLIFRELSQLYPAFCNGRPSPLPDLPVQYADFAVWQRERSEAGAWDEQLAFWKTQLKGVLPLLDLPTDRPRPALQSYRAARETRLLPKKLAQELGRISQKHGVSDASVFLAALEILLQRHSRQDDLVLGMPITHRDRPEWEGLAGNFANLLVLRTNLSGDPTFQELLARIQETMSAAFSHQEVPFGRLVEELRPARAQSYHPLFQVLFTRHEAAPATVSGNGLAISPMELDPSAIKFDLSFHVRETAQGLTVSIEYATDLFEARTIERMLGHWETLLEAIVAEPNKRVSEMPMLTRVEKQVVLWEWNQTEKEYPKDKTLTDLFEQQAARTPEAEALICGNARLTYGDLEARALRVAEHLRALGVGNETLVGICLERSWEMVAGILGTLRAGGAYVPMDPAYPKDRLAFMLEDAKVRVLLTQRKLLDSIPKTDAEILCIEDLNWASATTGRESAESEGSKARHSAVRSPRSTDLAYVIYTSGSTGRPKGVAIEHRSAVALVCWAKEVFSGEELSGMLASTSICFDLSVFEMFVPLSWGGKIILADNLLALPTLPAAKEVRLINTVPSAIRELIRVKGVPESVGAINLAGEPLATSLVDQIYRETSAQKVYDLYGPSETTTYSTFTLRKAGEPATIGRPLANEQVYLLDSHMQPAPIGVPGELYIGGDGLARGYLGRPDLTAERFVPNPFTPGARLYKTGDLARWRDDGNLEYIGRSDHQVKVRGFRIELGEIESVLKKQPSVREAVVIAREDKPGEKRLAAYVETNEKIPTADELRRAIRDKLPEYMIPSFFVFLEALPLTPNGKVDRKALPAPELDRDTSGAKFIAPRTEDEERLAGIWREVLGLKGVGINDNFFDLGGHSLLAVQAVSRIRELFKVELPLMSLFDAPTIGMLADGLAANRWTATQDVMPSLKPVSREGHLPVSFVQERLWFLDQLAPGSHAYNVPLALRLTGRLNAGALERALNEVIQRHEVLRTTLAFADDNLAQVIAPSLALELKAIDLKNMPQESREARAQEIVNEEAQRPFELGRGPLLRASLIRLDETDHVFSIVLHHTISDGWSLAIFFQELEVCYNAFAAGKRVPQVPPLPIQYVDFAQWQRNWMQGKVLEGELAYWKKRLAGAPSKLELPADHAEPDKPDLIAAQRTLQISELISNQIAEMSQRQGATPFMVLMTALAITLHKWSAQKDLVIGTVVAGRNRREFEHLIGCFMNFLPVRTKLAGTETAQEVLAAVRTAVLEGQNHQECPFEKMVEAINPQRSLNQNPLYNVALLLQSFPAEPFRGEGLRARAMPVSMRAALLDLRFEACQGAAGTELICEYRTDLFDEATIEQLLRSYQQSLETLVREPQTRLSDFKVTPGLEAQARKARARKEKQTIAIAATFTAEPLEEPLRYWMKELEISASIEFAPYNQIFQQLLDPASLLCANQHGLNVLLVRLEDWQRAGGKPEGNGAPSAHEQIQRSLEEFILAIKTATARSFAPCLICLCPPSSPIAVNPAWAKFLTQMEGLLRQGLSNLAGVYLATSGEMAEWYPVWDYYDPAGEELGHVPYTPLFFTSLATVVTRKFHALLRPTHKVIVLDCDHTLWSGVCGEDGAKGIRLDPPYQALQKFMRAQHEAGMLLCLCSKNNEEDVQEVFAQRLDMPLRREHFIGTRLNWQPKSENLKSLAEELQLGLDSFIFIDDNPVECAEVEANCPEVLTLQLPEDPAQIAQFLKHCWVFDHLKQTAEDGRRTEMYGQNRQREQLRAKTMSLAEFLSGLELKIQITPMSPEQLTRVAQLTQRTNQFNFTTRRRSESELQKLMGNSEVLAVQVSDRFGDYGLVGAIIFEVNEQSMIVDTFLLSCRVLGRGVEHQMLGRLGKIARERHLQWVDVHFTKTARNKPAHDFLETEGALFKQAQNGGFLFRFPARFASELEFRPQTAAAAPAPAREVSRAGSRSTADFAGAPKFARCRAIAMDADEASKIHHRMELMASSRSGKQSDYAAPRTDMERHLCELWQKLLHMERVGVRDNFFELGGHSLLAVRLFVEVERITGCKFPVVTLFQAPTIEQLAQILCQDGSESSHSLLVPIQPQGSKPPLFLVHGAGGDVLWGYANLAAHLPPDQPIYGIKSRGQAGLDEFARVEQMASYYLEQVRAFQPQGPYYLGGYCFGGNVAYEMARQLHAHGECVALVALLDSAPANAGYEKITWWRPGFVYSFICNLFYWLGDFRDLKPQARRSFIARKLRAVGRKTLRRFRSTSGTARIDLEDVIEVSHFPENELKLWRVHLEALTDHVQQSYPGQVTLFRTRGQPLVCSFEEDFCWSKLAQAGVRVKLVPGSHENIFMEPNVQSLAKELQTWLGEAHARFEAQTPARLAVK